MTTGLRRAHLACLNKYTCKTLVEPLAECLFTICEEYTGRDHMIALRKHVVILVLK